jgi:hypothetical protein
VLGPPPNKTKPVVRWSFVFEAQVSGDHLLYWDILEGFWSQTNAWIKQERWITDVYTF